LLNGERAFFLLKLPLQSSGPEPGIQGKLRGLSRNAFELPLQLSQSPGTVYEICLWNPVDVSFRVTE